MTLRSSARRLLARLRRLRIFRVSGESMRPTLRDGDWVLVDACGARMPSPGDLVVVRDPDNRVLVKRVRSRSDKTFAVGSDNPLEARDSRHFGSLSPKHLVGNVIAVRGVRHGRSRRVGRPSFG